MTKYNPEINPENNKIKPIEPKKCKGRFTKRVRKETVIKSKKPFTILVELNLDFPYSLDKFTTFTSPILKPFSLTNTGIYLCSSP